MAKKSHPGCKIGLVLDQDTLLENNGSVDVLHRLTIDKDKFGRNEYNDLYHWQVGFAAWSPMPASFSHSSLHLLFAGVTPQYSSPLTPRARLACPAVTAHA